MGYFISESSVYSILNGFDLVQSPGDEMVSAKDKYEKLTRRVHELWQTDFTHFKVLHWGWYYLSIVLDDYSRYIIAWKLAPTMASDALTCSCPQHSSACIGMLCGPKIYSCCELTPTATK